MQVKQIPGHPGYFCDKSGKIVSRKWKAERIKAFTINNSGYAQVSIWHKNKATSPLVHRLIAVTFIKNPKNKPQVEHIDGNKLNNNSSNLRWCTQSENEKTKILHGRGSQGLGNGSAWVTPEISKEILLELKRKKTQAAISAKFKLAQSTVSFINSGKHWTVR